MLEELRTNGDAKKQDLYNASREKGPISYPAKVVQRELASPSLLYRVQNRPDVEGNLRLMKKQRTLERSNMVYIAPQAKSNLQATGDARFLLMEKVKDFLDGNKKVFLLLGDSGAGKSTFIRKLEFDLWQMYKANSGRIPLHINLPSIDKPEHDLITKQLRRAEFTDPQILEMKHYRKFILICDGYDESQQTHNLYMSNRLNQPGEWDAQMVISCRSEYLGNDYRDRFQPGNRNQMSDSSLFQEAVITPFSLDQVEAYIQQYALMHQPLWKTEDYKQVLELVPSLKELVKNPFLMTLALEVLPRMVDPGKNLSVTRVTRVELYDHFVEQWLERGKKRIGEKDLTAEERSAFNLLSDDGFTLNGVEYLKKLAVAIYKEQGGHPIVEYSRLNDDKSWKAEFFCHKENELLREACPLARTGNQHRFVHQSLLEYGLTRAVFDPQDRRNRMAIEPAMGRRKSIGSILSIESQDALEHETVTLEQEPDINSPLAWRYFVNDHSLLQFLEERVQQEPVLKQQLLAYIEHSKKDKKWRVAAANAITILVRAGVPFIGANLQGIRIPRADLSFGVFDSANLQGADLRKVNLQGIWLRQTELSRAQMIDTHFGELPFLTEEDTVFSCAYSPDGRSFATGLHNGSISVYRTSSWERTRVLKGSSDMVRCIVYSPNGDQLASACHDNTVRIWNFETGELDRTLTGHTDWVVGVAYSPRGNLIASASGDQTVRLWDVATGECRLELSGHCGGVSCVAYSPKGEGVASGSEDKTVRLWNVEGGDCSHILSGHSNLVRDVAYSPLGDQIASAGEDGSVRVWDAGTGICRHILTGHNNMVFGIAYSPSGDQLASTNRDGTIQLWDVDIGRCCNTLTGHSNAVFAVAFSPKGDQIASCSCDKTVRLWDVSTRASLLISSGHSVEVYSVKCSPKAGLIASCSKDNTIRLWDMDTGACRRILSGHTESVYSVSFSPEGDRVVSGCSGNTVRLWDVGRGSCIYTLIGHSAWVQCVVYSPQGNQVASASEDRTIRLWDLANGSCHGTLDGHSDGVMGVEYSPDGSQIASGSRDCTVRIWDAGTGECCRILVGHTHWVRSVAYSPQGNELASAGYDKTIRLWNVETGECRLRLTGHSDRVICVAFSQKDDLLASGSWDRTVRVWDVVSGQCRAVIENFSELIWSVAWGPFAGANHLITGCKDGSVLKWKVVSEAELCSTRLCWNITNGKLTMTGASIQDVHGLTELNKQLLRQRGAYC